MMATFKIIRLNLWQKAFQEHLKLTIIRHFHQLSNLNPYAQS
jgi:hypothetical protein